MASAISPPLESPVMRFSEGFFRPGSLANRSRSLAADVQPSAAVKRENLYLGMLSPTEFVSTAGMARTPLRGVVSSPQAPAEAETLNFDVTSDGERLVAMTLVSCFLNSRVAVDRYFTVVEGRAPAAKLRASGGR